MDRIIIIVNVILERHFAFMNVEADGQAIEIDPRSRIGGSYMAAFVRSFDTNCDARNRLSNCPASVHHPLKMS